MDEIETDRLKLRMFSLEDLDELAVIFSDPDVVRYIGTGQPAPREETERALDSIIEHWRRHGFGRWAAVHKTTARLVGYGGLRNFNGTPELVYLLEKQQWGVGLGTEMARAVLKFGFEDRSFDRVIAMTKIPNMASQRVMQKAGMVYECRDIVFGIEVVRYHLHRESFMSAPVEYPCGELLGRAFHQDACPGA